MAGLLADLKSRGMLKDTLVVWGGNSAGHTFLPGALDRKPAVTIIHEDYECGWPAAASRAARPSARRTTVCARRKNRTVNDIHASILYLLGLDYLKTTYMRNGRAERPTVTGGKLITKLWA